MLHLASSTGQKPLAAVDGVERLVAQDQSGTLNNPCLPVIRGLALKTNPNVPNRVTWTGRKTFFAQRQPKLLIEGLAVSTPPRVKCKPVVAFWLYYSSC
jgi:hypothetical protein